MTFEQIYTVIPLCLLPVVLAGIGFQLWRDRHNH